MFGVVPKILWNRKYPADANNLCNWAMRSMLICTDNRRILIDTGIGDKEDQHFLSHYYPNGNAPLLGSLDENGFMPEDITDVIMTHLHFDHCGGCVTFDESRTNLQLVFSNADHWVSKAQWETALNPNKRESASFLEHNIMPLLKSGKLKFIEQNGEFCNNINIRLLNGHTDGLIVPIINYNGQTIVYAADFIPAVAHLPIAWVAAYDIRPLVSMQEKQEFLTEALAQNYILFFEHDLYKECCTLQQTPKGVRELESFTLEQLKQNY